MNDPCKEMDVSNPRSPMKFCTTEEASMDKIIDIGHEIINYKSIQNFFFIDEMFWKLASINLFFKSPQMQIQLFYEKTALT